MKYLYLFLLIALPSACFAEWDGATSAFADSSRAAGTATTATTATKADTAKNSQRSDTARVYTAKAESANVAKGLTSQTWIRSTTCSTRVAWAESIKANGPLYLWSKADSIIALEAVHLRQDTVYSGNMVVRDTLDAAYGDIDTILGTTVNKGVLEATDSVKAGTVVIAAGYNVMRKFEIDNLPAGSWDYAATAFPYFDRDAGTVLAFQATQVFDSTISETLQANITTPDTCLSTDSVFIDVWCYPLTARASDSDTVVWVLRHQLQSSGSVWDTVARVDTIGIFALPTVQDAITKCTLKTTYGNLVWKNRQQGIIRLLRLTSHAKDTAKRVRFTFMKISKQYR